MYLLYLLRFLISDIKDEEVMMFMRMSNRWDT